MRNRGANCGPLDQGLHGGVWEGENHRDRLGCDLKTCFGEWRGLASRAGGNSFDGLANATTQWSARGAIEREVLDKGEKNYDFNIVRCKYAEILKELGLTDMEFIFSCGRDGSM